MFRRQRTRKERTVRSARWSPDQQMDRDELLRMALDRGVLTQVPRIHGLAFNSNFDSLKTLIEDRPELTDETKEFVAEYLGTAEVDRILDSRRER